MTIGGVKVKAKRLDIPIPGRPQMVSKRQQGAPEAPTIGFSVLITLEARSSELSSPERSSHALKTLLCYMKYTAG